MDNKLSLAQAWQQIKENQPDIRIRNAAALLKVSEVELLATQCGETVIRLRPEFKEILLQIEAIGRVMALTRNDDCVHERKGVYLHPSLDNPHAGVFVGDDIDLRIFLSAWDSVYAVQEMSRGAARYSLQFFGKEGEAIHKIYLIDDSDKAAYDRIVNTYIHPDQTPGQSVGAYRSEPATKRDEEIDVQGFQEEWLNLKDTHDFYLLLRKFHVTRTQALRLAPEGNFAVKVANSAARDLIGKASASQLPIMVFTGNRGMIQIHSGSVTNLMDYNEWFNVLDPEFNMHLREEAIVESWVVRKPTSDGIVTSLECFDAKGVLIVQLFGKRKPGIPEMQAWKDLVAELN